MKLSEVLQAVRLIKSGHHGIQAAHKHPASLKYSYMDMVPGSIAHQSPYGHLLLHPHFGQQRPLSGLASVAHGLRLGGTGTSASGAYGPHAPPGYHPSGYGGHVGVPSGGHAAPAGYDYHAATGPHTPIADTSGPVHITGKAKTSGSSTVTALTLLSFLFFLNILQGCLKDHMETMNPTVMVMTAGTGRTRVSKLAEMNSREQQHTILHSLPQPVITMNRGESNYDDDTIAVEQVPFSGGYSKNVYSNSNLRPDPEPEYYSSYANRTMVDNNNYQDRLQPPYRHYQRLTSTFSSPSSASSASSSPSSPSSLPNSGGNNNYYQDTTDPFYMRIN